MCILSQNIKLFVIKKLMIIGIPNIHVQKKVFHEKYVVDIF